MPDFFVVGAMKSGTTTLHAWLGLHPEVFLPKEKEPDFFTRERTDTELRRYQELFAPAGSRCTGEASTSYTIDRGSKGAADRIAEFAPEARIVYLVRDPVERIRSHYRHEVRRNREHRDFAVAVRDDPRYRLASCYHARIRPYVARFGDQVSVVPASRLYGDDDSTWVLLLEFLGLSLVPRPSEVRNVGADAASFTRAGGLLWRSGLMTRATRLPKPVRRLARPVTIGESLRQTRLIDSAADQLPRDVVNLLVEDGQSLRALLSRVGNHDPDPPWL